MEEYGFELYVGDWITVRDACRKGAMDALRSGQFSESRLFFPLEFSAGDIIFLQDAVARLLGSQVIELDFERDEPAGCMFADKIVQNWVSSIASVSPKDGPLLMHYWSERYFEDEKTEPNWHAYIAGTLGEDLIRLCRMSLDCQLDLIMIWFL